MIWKKILYKLTWLGYLGGLSYVVLFKGAWDNTYAFLQVLLRHDQPIERQKVYLIPFESTKLFLKNWEYAYARWNIFENVLLFIPLGLLVGITKGERKGGFLTFGMGFVLSLGFELIQYIFAIGEFDVDDIMLNVLGAMLGYVLISRLSHKGRQLK